MSSDRGDHELIQKVAYLNGAWVESERLALPVGDPAITQGVTAVERLRAYEGRLFQVDRHVSRWNRSTEALGIEALPNSAGMLALLTELVQRNQTWISSVDHYGVVAFASPGSQTEPTLVIDLYSIDDALISLRVKQGSPVVITTVQQPASACWPRDIKVRSRLHYYFADKAARQHGRDAIGILVDSDDTITESSVANLLIVENDSLVTPPRDQILWGVSLQVVLALADDLGIPWREERLAPTRLQQADEVMLTGTSCGLWFASSLHSGDHQVAQKPCGPIYRRLRRAFTELTRTTQ